MKRSPSALHVDFAAFDPDIVSTPASSVNDTLPVGDTIPLLVTMDTSGEWEVFGSTPETSSNASGFNASRNGFRTGEIFTCKIYAKKDHFEVYLNGVCLSLSEHMIPVGCIQSVIIEGDCRIERMLFGDKLAVEKSSRNSVNTIQPRLSACRSLAQLNLEEAKVIECLVREPSITSPFGSAESLFPGSDLASINTSKEEGVSSHSPPTGTAPSPPLASLHRAGSYQLVFDVSDGEEETLPDPVAPNRATSCCNLSTPLPNVIKRPSLLAPPKPVPQRYHALRKLAGIRDELSKRKSALPMSYDSPTKRGESPLRPSVPKTGFAIKVSHPVVQVRGAQPAPTRRETPSRCLPNGQRPLRPPSAIPVHVRNATNSGMRRPSLPMSIL
ncbi:unnamed protein product [Mesocestoides corti]|uniref:Galectin n=1 Tax=Mesocestoides corti TaxID=53468 RepID=A0A0R3UG76_MESCO|nr:unnamed protein product [Mesocestoides corti]